MDELTKRFIDSYEYLKKEGLIKSNSDFAGKLGVSTSMITEILKGRSNPGGKALQNIVLNFPIDSDWLLKGTGSMLKQDNVEIRGNAMAIGELHLSDNDSESPYIDLGNNQFLMVVPLIPIRASAGYRENFQDENYINTHYDKHYFPVTRQYRGRYFAFVVDGSSMDDGTSEAIIEGSTVTGREIQKTHWVNKFHLSSFQDYVIVHRDVILVKRIIEHDTAKGTITCLSLNPDKKKFPDFTLNLDECLQILNIVNVTQPR